MGVRSSVIGAGRELQRKMSPDETRQKRWGKIEMHLICSWSPFHKSITIAVIGCNLIKAISQEAALDEGKNILDAAGKGTIMLK